MAMRVGIDLVSAESVGQSIEAHGQRYLQRVYSEREVSDCRRADGRVDPQRLAARFAAKEAALKVLWIGDEAVPWRDVEVRRERSGRVSLSLNGQAARLAHSSGISGFSLSFTHERGCAAAVVIAEINDADN